MRVFPTGLEATRACPGGSCLRGAAGLGFSAECLARRGRMQAQATVRTGRRRNPGPKVWAPAPVRPEATLKLFRELHLLTILSNVCPKDVLLESLLSRRQVHATSTRQGLERIEAR